MNTNHTSLKQANFMLSETLLKEFRRLIPKGQQSQVVNTALLHELNNRKLKMALKDSFGAWKSENRESTHQIVREMRKERKF